MSVPTYSPLLLFNGNPQAPGSCEDHEDKKETAPRRTKGDKWLQTLCLWIETEYFSRIWCLIPETHNIFLHTVVINRRPAACLVLPSQEKKKPPYISCGSKTITAASAAHYGNNSVLTTKLWGHPCRFLPSFLKVSVHPDFIPDEADWICMRSRDMWRESCKYSPYVRCVMDCTEPHSYMVRYGKPLPNC